MKKISNDDRVFSEKMDDINDSGFDKDSMQGQDNSSGISDQSIYPMMADGLNKMKEDFLRWTATTPAWRIKSVSGNTKN